MRRGAALKLCSVSMGIFPKRESHHTHVTSDVFPELLGPTIKKLGVVVFVPARYSHQWITTGSVSVMMRVIKMVDRYGPHALLSQLSSSYHAMMILNRS